MSFSPIHSRSFAVIRGLPVFFFVITIGLAPDVDARVWTTTENRTFDAEYLSATETHVTVKLKDGRAASIEITRLSQGDRDFVAQQQSTATPTAPTTSSAPPTATTKIASPKPTTTAAPASAPASGTVSGLKGTYAEHITGQWSQFEGKGNLQCMLFGSPTLDLSKKWPLVVYLHGKGQNVLTESGTGFAKACAKPENYQRRPCFILVPQCPDTNGWGGSTGDNLLKTVKEMMRQLPIDHDRIYLVGYSMGGFGTFMLLNQEPRLFAAGVPIAGGADPGIARNLKKIPLWIFHGDKDTTVDPEQSRGIAKALEKIKGNAKYTEIAGEGHGIGGKLSDDPELHAWLFAQKRGTH